MNEISFWSVHGGWFIFFMFLFPRFTMLVTGIFLKFIGSVFPLYLIGWLIAPRLTIAILASYFYFHTNPVLCVITWLWALGGESVEKTQVRKRS